MSDTFIFFCGYYIGALIVGLIWWFSGRSERKALKDFERESRFKFLYKHTSLPDWKSIEPDELKEDKLKDFDKNFKFIVTKEQEEKLRKLKKYLDKNLSKSKLKAAKV